MNKKLSGILFSSFLYLSIAASAGATGSVVCEPIYGGGVVCPQEGNIVVNKTVRNPETGAFVDNLNINDPKFSAGQAVNFRISVTNTGGSELKNVRLRDIFPQFVNPANSGSLNITVGTLKADETRTFDLAGNVTSSDRLPSDKEIVCVVNQAIATADSGQTSQDNAQLCIQKKGVAPVTKGGLKVFPQPKIAQAPTTGPEMLGLLALIPTGIAGLLLRKRTSK